MLNEAYDLLQALRKENIELPSYQQGVVTPGRGAGPCLRVLLSHDSSISSIEALADEEWSGLWTFMDGNHNSRPVIRLNFPLLQISLEDAWWTSMGYTNQQKRENIPEIDKINALKAALGNAYYYQSFTNPYSDERCKKTPAEKASDLWARVREKSQELAVSLSGISGLENVQCVFERVGKLPDMEKLAVLLRSAISAKLESGKLPVDTIETLLVGKLKSNGGKWELSESRVQLAFDIDRGETVYRKKTRAAIESALNSKVEGVRREKAISKSGQRCAYGSYGPLQDAAFPNPQLPIVAEKGMPLVSMFSAAAANTRYSLTDSDIIPVGRMLASQMAKALLWATSEERKGKTWRGVASGITNKKLEQKDLFIAYVDGRPQLDAVVADFFGTDQESLDKQFEVDAKSVCDALNAISKELPSSKLRILVLRQVSPGQVQVVMSRTLDPIQIITGAKVWNEGAANLPSIFVPIPSKKIDNKLEYDYPKSPYPDQIVRLLSRQWIREGAKKDNQDPCILVTGPTLGSVIDLLVREPGKYVNVARDLLRRSLIQVRPLLGGLVGAIRTNRKERYNQYPEKSRYSFLIACSTIGIVLHALNSRKEVYMTGSAFAIGRMLALADDIHRCYCEVVRDGSIPPSLLGNSLLSMAMENPTRALAVLGDRLRIYIGWVKTTKEQNGASEERQIAIRMARNRRLQYEDFVEKVHEQGLPTKMDDVAKAHLLLGYLASTKEEK
jgi:hypothetical protein